MTDLVNRLRDRAYCGKATDALCEEAANEIERLRNGAVASCETVQPEHGWQSELLFRLTQAVLSGQFLNKAYRHKLTEAYLGYRRSVDAGQTATADASHHEPEAHAMPSSCGVQNDGPAEPAAWAISGCEYDTGCEYEHVSLFKAIADAAAECGGTVVPLYAHPPRVVRLPAIPKNAGNVYVTVLYKAALDAAGVKWEVSE